MHGDHLAGVHALRGIEHAAHRVHRRERVAIEDVRHVAQLVESDAVLPGDGAPRGDTRCHDLPTCRLHPLHEAGGAAVERNVGMQVAVPGMEHVADPETVTRGDLTDHFQHVGQGRAGNHRVLHHQVA